jgi:predicted Zn-dependent peptidase
MMKITHIRTPLHDTSVIRACLVLPLGSAFDPSDKAGLTHVLEHCLYAQAVQAWQNGQKQYVLEFFTATTFRDI